MNTALAGIIRILFAAGGPIGAWLLVHGLKPGDLDTLQAFLIGGVPVLMMAWSWWSNRQGAQVARVEAMPGVKQVAVDPVKANATLLSIARDDSRPKVTIAK